MLTVELDLLFKATSRSDAPSLAAHHSAEEAAQLQGRISDLTRIIHEYRRLTMSNAHNPESGQPACDIAAIEDDEPSTQRLNAMFWTTIASICKLKNFPEEYRPPFISLQGFCEYFEGAKPSTYPHKPAMPFPRDAEVNIYVKRRDGKISQKTAASYVFIGRRFIFHNTRRQEIFEHRLQYDCHPVSHHRSYHNPGPKVADSQSIRPQTVYFLREQDVSRLPNGNPEQARIEYVFEDYEAYMRFQGDVRGRRLIGEFHVNTLKSAFSTDGADANWECVKLWQEDDRPDLAILSSPAEFQEKKLVFEWAVRWFKAPEALESPTTAKLRFKSFDSRRRESISSQIIAAVHRRSSVASIPESPGESSSSSSSIYPVDSTQLSRPYAPSSWVRKVAFLKLDFHAGSEENKRASDAEECKRFFDAFTIAHSSATSTPSLGPSSPPGPSLSDSLDISSYMGSPSSPDSRPSRTRHFSTSTAATSPMSPAWQREHVPPLDQRASLPGPAASTPRHIRSSTSPTIHPTNTISSSKPRSRGESSNATSPTVDQLSARPSPAFTGLAATPTRLLFP